MKDPFRPRDAQRGLGELVSRWDGSMVLRYEQGGRPEEAHEERLP
jgi:pantoate kinase